MVEKVHKTCTSFHYHSLINLCHVGKTVSDLASNP